MLERRGVISGYEGSKPRQVLITHADLPRILGGGNAAEDAGEESSADGATEQSGPVEVLETSDPVDPGQA
jgi:S-DNA-T family DNA segregation ATPase FtsK/SpoIIIE